MRAFVVADIAGSSRLWNRYPERMSDALARHDALAAAAVRSAGGHIFKHTGDGFLAAFDDVESALQAMEVYQRELGDAARAGPIEIRSRVCVHFGAAEERGGDWFGPTLNALARLTDLVSDVRRRHRAGRVPDRVARSPRCAARIDLAGVGRTPLTISMTFSLATEIEFDLGLDRFAESLDPGAVDARAMRAAASLRAARTQLS